MKKLFWLVAALALASCQLVAQTEVQTETAIPAATVIPGETLTDETYLTIETAGFSGPLPPGETALQVTVRDGAGLVVEGASVQARGDMTHPGMTPIFGIGVETAPGVYRVPLDLNMGGDWVITIDATSANGLSATQQVNLQVEN
ncbi:MAG: FixH family protein [Anaerolineae bacterium]|nr:FixH family protein [Anaerolineae bacterium]